MIRIGAKVANTTPLQSITKPFLKTLAEKYEETICLLMLRKDKKQIFWADKVNGPKPLQYIIPIGEMQPIPYGGSGKTILAFLENDLIEEILNDEKFASTEKESILTQLQHIRNEKVTSTVSERLEGSTGIASPIFNHENHPVGSLLLTAPTPRVTPDVVKNASVDIRDAAKEISSILGSSL